MRDYYNIQKFASGGTLASVAGSSVEWLFKRLMTGKASSKLHGLSSMFNSRSPQFAAEIKTLNQMVKDKLKGTVQHSDTEIKAQIKKAQELAKPVFQGTKEYKNRIASIKARREQAQRVANAQSTNTTNTTTQAATQSAAPKKKGTIGSWAKSVGTWLNEHPAIVVPTALIGGGTGIGRWAVGSAAKASQWSPDGKQADPNQKYIKINGQRLPVSIGDDGDLILSSTLNKPSDDSAIDDAIAGASGNSLNNGTTTNAGTAEEPPRFTNEQMNEIFGDTL